MSCQRLMCVWETAAFVSRPLQLLPCIKNDTINLSVLKSVTKKVATGPFLNFSGDLFSKHFLGRDASIDSLAVFLHDSLAEPSIPTSYIYDDVEDKCWNIVKRFYKAKLLDSIKLPMAKVWKIFCCLTEPDSYPPAIAKSDMPRLREYHFAFVTCFMKCWTSDSANFDDFVNILNKMTEEWSSEKVEYTLKNELFDLVVEEVVKSEYLHVRFRTGDKWSDWLKRWVCVSPGKINCYDPPECNIPKEKFILLKGTDVSIVDDDDKKGFRITTSMHSNKTLPNIPNEVELYATDEDQCTQWVKEIQRTILSKVDERRISTIRQQRFHRISSVAHRGSISVNIFAHRGSVKGLSNQGKGGQNRVLPMTINEQADKTQLDSEEDRDKILSIFVKADADGNGIICRDEFENFMSMLGDIDRITSDYIFDIVDLDKSGGITFDEFYQFFTGHLLEPLEKFDHLMKSSSDHTDMSAEEKKQADRLKVLKLLQKLDDDEDDYIDIGDTLKKIENEGNLLHEHFKKLFNETSTADLPSFLQARWKSFSNFQRAGHTGEVVMAGGTNAVIDILPGTYFLADLAGVKMQGGKVQPRKAVFKNVVWEMSNEPGKKGQLVFPYDYDGSLPVEIATRDTLSYYDCFIADGSETHVSFPERHVIQDFNYMPKYNAEYVQTINGAGLEKHGFAHLDCPLQDDSGYFLIGKMIRDGDIRELHLTAFIVPTNHTIFVPTRTIHSNDYMKGLWRTMLSDQPVSDSVHIRRHKTKENKKSTVPIVFRMTGWWASAHENRKR